MIAFRLHGAGLRLDSGDEDRATGSRASTRDGEEVVYVRGSLAGSNSLGGLRTIPGSRGFTETYSTGVGETGEGSLKIGILCGERIDVSRDAEVSTFRLPDSTVGEKVRIGDMYPGGREKE